MAEEFGRGTAEDQEAAPRAWLVNEDAQGAEEIRHVVDFVDLHAAGWHWPAFNVADSAITIGAALLILDGFRHHEGRARAAS